MDLLRRSQSASVTPRAANIQRLGPQIAVTKAATNPPVFTLVPGSVTVPATSPPRGERHRSGGDGDRQRDGRPGDHRMCQGDPLSVSWTSRGV
jgi:hypothetical protein